VRVFYSVSYQAFAGAQPPFRAIEPMGYGLRFFTYITTICAGVGFVLLSPHLFFFLGRSTTKTSLSQGLEVFGGSAFLLLGVWYARTYSARDARRQQEEFLRDSYSRLHCRDERFVETTDDGLLLGCNCESVLRPWAIFAGVGETDGGFALFTNFEVVTIPKAAFHSGGEQTEFRAILAQRLNENKSATARAVEFACNQQDWRNAAWLQFKMGGWIRVAALTLFAFLVAGYSLFQVPYFDVNAQELSPPLIAGACIYALLLLTVALMFRRKPFQHSVPMKVWFAEDAIYIQQPVIEMRIPWSHMSGCLADKKSLLLGQRDKSVILIPQRFISPIQREYIMEMLQERIVNRTK
jgi:hypothetical protein